VATRLVDNLVAVADTIRQLGSARVVLDGFLPSEVTQGMPFFQLLATSAGWKEHSQERESLRTVGGTFTILYCPAWIFEQMFDAVENLPELDWSAVFQVPGESTSSERRAAVWSKYLLTGGSMRELLMTFLDAQKTATAQITKVSDPGLSAEAKHGQANLTHHVTRCFCVIEEGKPNYEKPIWRVDSQYQLRKLMDLKDLSFYQQQLEFGRSRGGCLYGLLFEEFCHKYIADKKMVKLRVRALDGGDWEELTLNFVTTPTFGVMKGAVYKNMQEDFLPSQYWKPGYGQLPVDDAGCVVAFLGKTRPVHIQYTVARRKPHIDLQALSELDHCYELNKKLDHIEDPSIYLILEDNQEKAEAVQVDTTERWALASRSTPQFYVGHPVF
jgi:hypothetical protein